MTSSFQQWCRSVRICGPYQMPHKSSGSWWPFSKVPPDGRKRSIILGRCSERLTGGKNKVGWGGGVMTGSLQSEIETAVGLCTRFEV